MIVSRHPCRDAILYKYMYICLSTQAQYTDTGAYTMAAAAAAIIVIYIEGKDR